MTFEECDDDCTLYIVGEFFEGDGTLIGDEDVTVEAPSVDTPASLIAAGVVSDGNLDISEFGGNVEVSNDNSSAVEPGLCSSAVSVGVAAIDFDQLLEGIFDPDPDAFVSAFLDPEISGPVNQTITVFSESNDVITSYDPAFVFAGSFGLIGNVTDGITEGSNISVSATGGSATSVVASFPDLLSPSEFIDLSKETYSCGNNATAATFGLSVGVGGAVGEITGDVSISASTETDNAVAVVIPFEDVDIPSNYSPMGNATAASVSVATGVAGIVGEIDGGADSTVIISAEAAAGDAMAVSPEYSKAITAAGALGLGAGVVGMDFWDTDVEAVSGEAVAIEEVDVEGSIVGAQISATAETGNAAASSYQGNSSATNLAGAVAVGGVVSGDVSGSTLTAFAESGHATADDTRGNASANTIAASGGVVGLIENTLTDTTIEVNSMSGNAEAVSEGWCSYHDAYANSIAFSAGILGGVTAVSNEVGLVEIDVSATSGNAGATNYDAEAYANSSAIAYGIKSFGALEEDLYSFSEIPQASLADLNELDNSYTTTQLEGTINVTAVSGDAIASDIYYDDYDYAATKEKNSINGYDNFFATAEASATGFYGDIAGNVAADITATATSGAAEAVVDSGLFTAVGVVNVYDMGENTLDIAEGGGLAPILRQDPADEINSRISIHGNGVTVNTLEGTPNVVIAEGAIVQPFFESGVDMANLMKHGYTLIDTEGTIIDNGAIVDNSHGPFEYSLRIEPINTNGSLNALSSDVESPGGEAYILTVENVKDQNGEHTSGTVQSSQAAGAASQAVMYDISEHALLLRSLLRGASTSTGAAPTGAAGPNMNSMRNGEWLAYMSLFGNLGRQESGNGYAGFDYETYGTVIGMEKLLGEQCVIGLAGSFANTDIDGKQNSGGGDSDLYSGAVYVNWFTDAWYVDGGFTYGRADNDVFRIDFEGDRYHGDYYSDIFGTWIETGYAIVGLGNFELEPYGRLMHSYSNNDGYTDEGPDLEVMTIKDYKFENLKSETGARLNFECVYKERYNLLVALKAAWQHEWDDRNVSVDATYLGDSTLRIESANANRDALVLGILGELTCDNGISIGFEYEPTLGGNWHNQSLSATLQYNW